jgi:ssDNA-binding Zn-finger/Zn-ribbon topoisomerase 1
VTDKVTAQPCPYCGTPLEAVNPPMLVGTYPATCPKCHKDFAVVVGAAMTPHKTPCNLDRCQERVTHRYGWGYARPCARKATTLGTDSKWRCTFHAKKVSFQ